MKHATQMNDILIGLNSKQQEAVSILEGPVLVLAVAGSGKTRVITCRIMQLIESGVPASAILGLTFTNKAAGEMKERINRLSKNDVLICTFHSLGARILRKTIHHLGYERDFTIYDEEDVEKLIKATLAELNIVDKKLEPKTFRNLISKTKNSVLAPEDVDIEDAFQYQSDLRRIFPAVYNHYQMKMKQYNALDFDDLLNLTVRLFKEHPQVLEYYQKMWPFILIDEYQDTNQAQYSIAHLLAGDKKNIFAVGDPDQSIYSWRGANIDNILNFEKDYPGTRLIRLEQNYRSTNNILEAANALISCNENRYKKELWSDLGQGEKIKLFIGEDDREEADFVGKQINFHRNENQIPLNEMVVFYRTNAQSRTFEDRLAYYGIPYVIVGGISFYQRREIKDILAFLRIVQSGADFISFARTINIPKRGFGDATIEKIRIGADQERLTIMGYCEALISDAPLKDKLRLTSKQKDSLADYLRIIHELKNIAQEGSIRNLVMSAIERTSYLSYLKEDPESYEDRKENLDALISKAIDWEFSAFNPSLESFLEELSLKSSLDEAGEAASDRLSLMTIHNGKGLEFKVTFLVGLEEDLFPHINSKKDMDKVEEERRLCYVGITRAKEHLYLTHCHTRYLWGNLRFQRPSRFLEEIPREYIEKIKSKKHAPQVKRVYHEEPTHYQEISHAPISPSTEKFEVGDTVFHKDFGIGQIKNVAEGSLGLTYKVFFTKDNSTRSLVARYAQLKKL